MAKEHPMSARQGFAIIIASALGFATAGGGIGRMMGTILPGYYRAVFPGGEHPGFDPIQVGTGLGLTQGLIAGLVVGSVVVLAIALAGRRG